jgi:hypothetical protein
MASEEKHSVRNSILGTVIGGLLLAFLLWLIPGLWAWLVSAIGRLAGFLISQVNVPVWLVGIMILAIIPTIIMVVLLIVASFRRPSEPTWLDYTTDRFDGMTWRWKYINNGVSNLGCFCPYDDTRLIYVRGYENASLHCETCKAKFGPFDGDIDYIHAKIERQIERKVQKDEWRKVVSKEKVI